MLAGALLASRPASALDGTSEKCLTCHRNHELSRSRDGSNVSVQESRLAASVHGKLQCVACHLGAGRDPHPDRLPRVQCEPCHKDVVKGMAEGVHRLPEKSGKDGCRGCHGTHDVRPAKQMTRAACESCHADVAAQYRESVHGRALASGDNDASTCRDCHGGTHQVKKHTDPTSPVSHDSLATTCARCHEDRRIVERRKITIPSAVALYRQSIHGRSKDPKAATCDDCHESHRMKRANDPTSSIYRANIPKTCGRCHEAEAKQYTLGVHGQALERGVTRSPVCTDCHGEHRITGPHDPNSPVAAGSVTSTCVSCHEATAIRETFGLPAGRLSSYTDSFHGLAARGGSKVVANCASCHGAHEILPSSDPRSTVSRDSLATTCGRCHPGDSASFARGRVHVVMARREEPVSYWVRISYLWLIALTIGGMTVHQGLHFVRQMRARWRAQFEPETHPEGPRRWCERMTTVERIQHGLLAVSFFTLVGTGFALKFPEAPLFEWIARLEGGHSWRSLLHRIAAIAMVAVSVIHVGYLFTKRGRALVRDLAPQPSDAWDVIGNGLYLAGLRSHPPRFARFSYIEKAEYWALVWGTIVMTVTGFILWFENESLRHVNLWVINAATLVHYYEAWLAFLAIVVWHLYQNIANPEVYPMNWTWLHGRISEEQMKHEHRAWYDELTKAEIEGEDANGAADGKGAAEPPDATEQGGDRPR